MKGEIMGEYDNEHTGFQAPEYTEDSFRRVQFRQSETVDPNQYVGMYPPNAGGINAHAQMLAARVEGLEKDINGLQHVWGRVKSLESEVARLTANKESVAVALLKRCLFELPTSSDLTGNVAEFLRNR